MACPTVNFAGDQRSKNSCNVLGVTHCSVKTVLVSGSTYQFEKCPILVKLEDSP